MIKLYENCWLDNVVYSVTHKFLISDTTLRSFIPPQVRKITSRLRQICGCDIYIIPKYIQIDLNIIISNLATNLQQKYIGRHTCNSVFSTKSDAHYKEEVFPDVDFLHAAIKYAAHCIS